MDDLFPDGLYHFKTLGSGYLLTEANGALVGVQSWSTWGKAVENHTWQLENCDADTVTLRCVGTSNYLAMTDRDGIYYLSAQAPQRWRIQASPKGEGYDLFRADLRRAIWLGSFALTDPQPLVLQGVDSEVTPTRWMIDTVPGDDQP